MTTPPVPLDPTYLGDIIEAGGEAFAREVADTFVAEAARRRQALQEALMAGDWTAAAQAAHAIVSGASMLGLVRVTDAARGVERVAQEQRRPPTAALGELDTAVAEAGDLLTAAIAAEAARRGGASG